MTTSTASPSFDAKKNQIFFNFFFNQSNNKFRGKIKSKECTKKMNGQKLAININCWIWWTWRSATDSTQGTDHELPSRRSIDTILTNMYESKKKIKKRWISLLKLHGHLIFGLTLELNFFAIARNWIMDDYNLLSVVLECVNVDGRHFHTISLNCTQSLQLNGIIRQKYKLL